MKNLEKFIAVALVVATVSVVLFWAAGFNGRMDVAQWLLITAGISCWGALIGIGWRKLHQRNFY